MCGLTGFWGNLPDKETILKNMMTTIKHRGPDEDGEAYLDQISLGHVRLSIIDLEHGKQPIKSEDGRFTMVFNGEIYNYLELRQLLSSKGHRFKTYSDSEVLLNAYIEFGKKVVDYLNGMFVFVIYDQVTKEMFIARDHFGIKPFYYYTENSHFIFASEIKALFKHPLVKKELDSQSLFEFLHFQFVLKKHTLFKNILKLEPATYMVIKNGEIAEKVQYWNLEFNINPTKSVEEYADELLVLLDSSMQGQVRSDVPVGAYLSGGIDSSIVSVLAANHYMGNLKTFTGGFHESPAYDETYYARIISKKIHSDHYEIFPTAADFIATFEKLVYHMDEPAAGPGLFPQYMVSSLASKHVKVVLGGQGGDEVFGGYARYAVAYLEQCIKGAIFENQEEGKHVVTLPSIISNLSLLKQYVPMIRQQFSSGLFDDMEKRYYRLINRSPNLELLFNKDLLHNFNEEDIFSKYLEIFNASNTPSYFNKMTFFDMKTLLPALLQVEDRVSMAVSLESRVPLLDKRIVELAATIPPTYKFAGGKTKYMLIQAVKNILPKEIIERKDKMGFPVPLNEWYAGPIKEYVMDIFSSKKTKERGIFNIDNITRSMEKEEKFSRDTWGAMNLEMWFRLFLD
ncbi:MAG: asparagine synthase (glutamine-hydrolyzing) [Bacteroidota bacterium]